MPAWTVLPFAALLVTIAVLPLLAPHWWHSNRNKGLIALLFAAPVFIYVARQDWHLLLHTALEYAAFVSLLGALFTIAGGVRVQGIGRGSPASNAAVLAAGALLANFAGTTGAAMLLIRPFLDANASRTAKSHLIVFFIFIVANAGGLLTPLGDPPLYLGFLRGVPFTWTFRLWAPWLMAVGLLLALFLALDYRYWRSQGKPTSPPSTFRILGSGNLVLIAGVVGTVMLGGLWIQPRYGEHASQIAQCVILILLASLSMAATPKKIRQANGFSWHPYIEVVLLFAGIFIAMIPALAVLKEHGPRLGATRDWHYFWLTGTLSAFLDNAPTYAAFLTMAQHLPDEVAGTAHRTLAAISCGAVFFGAMTYIGNGPNFMVKAIAESRNEVVPSFFGYMGWALVVLVPILLGVTLVFFR